MLGGPISPHDIFIITGQFLEKLSIKIAGGERRKKPKLG